MSLTYYVELKHQMSGNVQIHGFTSPHARAALIAGLTPFTTVIREWEE